MEWSEYRVKKYLLIIVSILIFITLIFVVFLPEKTNTEAGKTVTLICAIEDMDVNTELSAEHSKIITEIFNNKALYDEDPPLCPCNKNFSFKIGKKTFCIAVDGCPTIYIDEKSRYFYLTEEENEIINDILMEYGVDREMLF